MIKSIRSVPESAPRSLIPISERKDWDGGDGGLVRGKAPPPISEGRTPAPGRPSFPGLPLGHPHRSPFPSLPPLQSPRLPRGRRPLRPPLTHPVPTPTAPTSRWSRARYLLVEAADHGLDPFHRPVRGHVLPAAGGRRRDGAAGAQGREEGGERGPR